MIRQTKLQSEVATPKSVLVITEGPLDRRNGAGCRALLPYVVESGVEQIESWFCLNTGYFGDVGAAPKPRYIEWRGKLPWPGLLSWICALKRIRTFDRVLAVPDGWRGVWMGLCARLVNPRVCFWIMDDWVQVGTAGKASNPIPRMNWKNAIKKYAIRLLAQTARVRLVVSKPLKEGIQQEFHVPVEGVIGRTVLSRQIIAPHVRKAGQGEGRFRFVWVGTFLGHYREPIQLLNELFLENQELAQRFDVDLYGLSVPPDGWTSPNIIYRGGLEDDSLIPTLSTYDAALLTYSFDPATRQYLALSFPSKLVDYLAAALPVLSILPPEFDVAMQLGQRQIGAVVTQLDKDRIRQGLNTMAQTTSGERLGMSERAHSWATQEFVRDLEKIRLVMGDRSICR